ncbi:rubrerythrin family protein [Cloacibacillus sp. An23]|uniref:rubrerythrin family protein n=1 Tax=Cloacibacillus sp. An23 TaxID=1965591 RepID=UPI000B38AC27|nr:rubrerythrin family protein [Cloacibacillus sp. An23]OUO92747.1 rubrerythrin [Cloacibacillus sp. An23]
MSTKDNLATAFAGESQANRKYLMFAEQAEKEGHKGAAKLFRAAAEAEQIHAFAEFRANGGVGTTAENLQAAINGETYEFTEMYPPMIKEAEAEGDKTAARVFHLANEAEKVHAQLYKEALADIDGDADYYLCPFCGYIHKGKTEEACPICGAKASMFKKF